MESKHQYYQLKRFNNSFIATDKNGDIYFFEKLPWGPDYWQRATWKNSLEIGKSRIDNPDEVRPLDVEEIIKLGVKPITSENLKDQPPHEYYQDIEEDWIYYARDEDFNVFIYRNPVGRKYKRKPPKKWEKVTESDFMRYCRKNIGLLQQSDPRTEEYLLKEGVPLIIEKEVIECTDNHIYT